jgi:hypothetical protein
MFQEFVILHLFYSHKIELTLEKTKNNRNEKFLNQNLIHTSSRELLHIGH